MNILFFIFQNTAVLKVSKKTRAKWVVRHEAHVKLYLIVKGTHAEI